MTYPIIEVDQQGYYSIRSSIKGVEVMPEHEQISQETWIRETKRCLAFPSVYLVLQGEDARYYPVRRVVDGGNLLVELINLNGSVVSFEYYAEAVSFCRAYSSRLIHFC